MHVRSFVRTIAVAALGWALTAPVSDASTHDSEAGAFITSLANEAIEVLRDESMSLEDREAHFRSVLNEGFALDKIGRFVVGRHWRDMSPDQQLDYQQLYGKWVLKKYSAQLGGYSGQTFQIVKSVVRGENDVFVRTRIDQPDEGAPIICDWRVREIDGRLKVIDVVIEGISMLVTQRSEFSSVIRQRGVDGLIEALRARVSMFPAVAG